jgi:hypothetical protein
MLILDEVTKQRLLTEIENENPKDMLAILDALRLIREEKGWGSMVVNLKVGTVDEVQTVISRCGANLRT